MVIANLFSSYSNVHGDCLLHGVGNCQCPQAFYLNVSGTNSFVEFNQPACFMCPTNDAYVIFEMTLMNSSNIMILPDNTLRVVDPGMLFSNTTDTILRCGARFATVRRLGELLCARSASFNITHFFYVLLFSVQPSCHHSCEPSGCGRGDEPDTHL